MSRVTPISSDSAIGTPVSKKPVLRSASSCRVSLKRTTSPSLLFSMVQSSWLELQNRLYLNPSGGSDESPTTTRYEKTRVGVPLPDEYMAHRSFVPTNNPNFGGEDSFTTTGALNCTNIVNESPLTNVLPWSLSENDTSSKYGCSPSITIS